MGTTQAGLPHPSAILPKFHVGIIDVKDCLFQIPLAPQHRRCFAFTVWEPNMIKPAKRYQWTVLPRGVKNCPTICQLYVGDTIKGVPRAGLVVHYRDDIMLACPISKGSPLNCWLT